MTEQIAAQDVFDVAAAVEDRHARDRADECLRDREHADEDGVANDGPVGGRALVVELIDGAPQQLRDRDGENVGPHEREHADGEPPELGARARQQRPRQQG